MPTYKSILTLLIIAILISGGAIYLWNLAHGRNLAIPPELNMSSFPSLDQYVKLGGFFTDNQPATVNATANNNSSFATNNATSTAGYVYFKNSFQMNTPKDTAALIADFLNDFPSLKKSALEILTGDKDFSARLKYDVSVPGVAKELDALKKNYGDVVDVR
ncbi:MAG: hypothetical protein V1763_01135 [Parcubacteria group bacterium]